MKAISNERHNMESHTLQSIKELLSEMNYANNISPQVIKDSIKQLNDKKGVFLVTKKQIESVFDAIFFGILIINVDDFNKALEQKEKMKQHIINELGLDTK